jgi:hypothetical protein
VAQSPTSRRRFDDHLDLERCEIGPSEFDFHESGIVSRCDIDRHATSSCALIDKAAVLTTSGPTKRFSMKRD